MFWVYWAVSLPLIINVILLWTAWYRSSINQHRIKDEQKRGKGAIFGALGGTNDQMEVEFEYVKRKMKSSPTRVLSFLAGIKQRRRMSDSDLSEDVSQGSMRKKRRLWQRLSRMRPNLTMGAVISETDLL